MVKVKKNNKPIDLTSDNKKQQEKDYIHCRYDSPVLLGELKPHPKNRNKHSPEQIDRLTSLLKYQGIRAPVIVSKRSGYIVKGHGTVEAIKKAGWSHAPVVYQDFESDEQEYAFIQSDNAIASWADLDLAGINSDIGELGPDFDIDLLGIKDFTLDLIDKQRDEDEVPEPEQVEPKTKPGDLYILGNHRLLCGDSTNIQHVEKLLGMETADIAYCDPPYGADIVNKNGKLMAGTALKAGVYAPIIGDDTTNTAKDAFSICSQLCKTLIFWGAQYYAEFLPPNSGWIVWDKQTDGSLGDGELAYSNIKKAVRIFQHKWSGMIKASEQGQRRVHPTQKPIALAEWCLDNYGDNNKNVLDLFGGSGSTLIACEKTNRKCFMMELDPHYCDVIVARWEKYTGKKSELITNG